ncbi:MAG: T9SS type A sorting domain-containing protein [Sphingobacteriales bacterium]|nr:T9SS type A sorting domain-containing protein [Sphingobacteriales bacterium]MBI3719003.1 T9SS type A sorting domain-containing protein [Sphingobacteriales bacterium]
MKKPIALFIILHILSLLVSGQQASVQIVLNYSPGSCKVQVEYWLKNNSSSGSNMQIAVANSVFQWDSSMFTLFKDSACTAKGITGQAPGLNGSDFFPGFPDNDIYGTRALNGTNFRTLNIQRSTNDCDSLYVIPGQTSRPLGLVVLQFRNCSDANAYNFTDTSASNYIADVNDGVSPASLNRKILLIVNNNTRSLDQSGKPCKPGNDFTNTNPLPTGDTTNTYFIPQAPLITYAVKNFRVFKENKQAILKWQVEGGDGIKEFEVERKTSAGFEKIGFVNSKSPDGNSNENISYSFNDNINTVSSVVFYRLKLVGHTGKSSYSEIRAVSNQKFLQVLIYPNPTNGKINIVLPQGGGTTDINMIDFSGKLIRSWNDIRTTNLQLCGLQRGIYTLLISSRETGEKVAQKITVQ